MAEQNVNQPVKIADRSHVIVHGQIVFARATQQRTAHELVSKYDLDI